MTRNCPANVYTYTYVLKQIRKFKHNNGGPRISRWNGVHLKRALFIAKNFWKNCMKLKKFGSLRDSSVSHPPFHPCSEAKKQPLATSGDHFSLLWRMKLSTKSCFELYDKFIFKYIHDTWKENHLHIVFILDFLINFLPLKSNYIKLQMVIFVLILGKFALLWDRWSFDV